MCTLVILRRPENDWPLILAANRDERIDRAWHPPARHWDDRENVVAGADAVAGGTWLGLNDSGLVAGVMNREGSLGPVPDKRSRGELVLEALDHADADQAAMHLSQIDGTAYRPFNLLIADNRDAFWLKSTGSGPVSSAPIPIGVSMLTIKDLNDRSHERIDAWLPRFQSATAPTPEDGGDWSDWEALMAGGQPTPQSGPRAAMSIADDGGYGTVSSSLIALPSVETAISGKIKPIWLFCGAQPGTAPYTLTDLS